MVTVRYCLCIYTEIEIFLLPINTRCFPKIDQSDIDARINRVLILHLFRASTVEVFVNNANLTFLLPN